MTQTIITILKSILFIALAGWLLYGCVLSFTKPSMAEIAETQNCRWDYNGMCYTKDQRPWLFD